MISLLVLSFIMPILAWNVPLISQIFLKRSLVFPILLFSSTSLHCLLKNTLSFLAILWNSTLNWVYLPLSLLLFASLLSLAICKAFSDNHFAFLHFFCFGMVLVTDSCTMFWTSVLILQALCLPNLIPWIYSSPPLFNHKGFDLHHTQRSSGFSSFLQFKPEFCSKELMIWAAVSSRSCFCWLCRVSPSLSAKNITSLILVLTIWWCPCVESSLLLL